MPKIKVKGLTVQTGERPQTDRHTDATKRIIAPATRSIIIEIMIFSEADKQTAQH